MDPQSHSFLHFILKPTKKEIGKGMGLFNSGEIKTKLLTLPLTWACQSTTKCTLHLDSQKFHVNPILNLQEMDHRVTRTAFRQIIKPQTSLCS